MKIALLVALILASTAFAGSITVSTGGTYSAGTQTDTYFAPNATWSLSFTIDSAPTNPVQLGGTTFRIPYSNAIYLLNGSPVALTGTNVNFYGTQSFDICLDAACVFQLGTYSGSPQLYTGTADTPVFVPGTFPVSAIATDDFSGSQTYIVQQPATTIVLAAAPDAGTPTPEPATWALTLGGALSIGIRKLGRRANR